MPNCEALHRSDFYCYSFNGVSADYASYGSPMPMRRNLVQCSVVYDTTISNIYALNDTFNGAGNTGSFVGAIGTTVANPSGNELEVSSTTVYPVISSTISTTTGKEYTVSADLNGMSFSPGYTASVLCEVIEGGVTVASQSSTAPGNFNFTYTAGAGSASVRYTFVLTPNPGPPPPPPMAPFSFTLDNALVYFIDTSISSETVCLSKSGYRYGFNGMEKDFELGEEGNYYTAEFWEYESRLGRRWNLDPIIKINLSNYSCLYNNPIHVLDPKGDDGYVDADGNYLGDDGNKNSHDTRVISKELWESTVGKNKTVTSVMRDKLVKNSTLLQDYKKGINIGENTWKKLEAAGGKRIKPWLINNSSSTVWAQSENGDEVFEVNAGTDLYFTSKKKMSGIDGFAAPHLKKGEFFKVVDGTRVTITNDGMDIDNDGSTKRYLGNLFTGGWKNEAWLKRQSANTITIYYKHWFTGTIIKTTVQHGDKQFVEIFSKAGLINAKDYLEYYVIKEIVYLID